MNVKFTKNHYRSARRITWEDVMKKIHNDCDEDMWIWGNPPTFVCRSIYTPRSIFNVQSKVNLPELHVYVSFVKESAHFGNHCDDKDVLLVQAIGKMEYEVEGVKYNLLSGDSLYIPKGVYHAPNVVCPRATLSFSESA